MFSPGPNDAWTTELNIHLLNFAVHVKRNKNQYTLQFKSKGKHHDFIMLVKP